MGKYKCKACRSINTITTKHPIRTQRYIYCNDCGASVRLVEYLPQKILGEFKEK